MPGLVTQNPQCTDVEMKGREVGCCARDLGIGSSGREQLCALLAVEYMGGGLEARESGMGAWTRCVIYS